MKEKKELIQWFGLLGVISFLSYVAAVVFSPLAYPGYDWRAQAVSDLSAVAAPSKMLWTQISALYDICGIVSVTILVLYIQGKLNQCLRVGGYRKKQFVSLAVFATMALGLMFIGAIGTNIVPKEYFGVVERFSVMSATGFNAVLGIYQFRGMK